MQAWPAATISRVESDDVPPWYRWLPSRLATYSTAPATRVSSNCFSVSEVASHSSTRPVERQLQDRIGTRARAARKYGPQLPSPFCCCRANF